MFDILTVVTTKGSSLCDPSVPVSQTPVSLLRG